MPEQLHWMTREDAAIWTRLAGGPVSRDGHFNGRKRLSKRHSAARFMMVADRTEREVLERRTLCTWDDVYMDLVDAYEQDGDYLACSFATDEGRV